MIEECERCSKLGKLENWGGAGRICPSCIAHYKDRIPTKRRGDPSLVLEEPTFSSNSASYSLTDNEIIIRGSTEDIEKLITWISHEFTHYLLHQDVGLKACFQYDLISSGGELDYPLRGL